MTIPLARRPLWLAALAVGLCIASFSVWTLAERYVAPSLTFQGLERLHLMRGVLSTLFCSLLIVFIVHLSDKKAQQIERRFLERDAKLADALKESGDAIVGVDSRGNVAYWNKGAESLYGYPPGEIMGQPFETLLADVGRRTEGGQALHNHPFEEFLSKRLTKSGEKLSVLVTRVTGGGTLRECTGCQAIEQNLVELRALERQLSQSEKMASMGEMAAGLAHEIKNPLAGISGAIQVLGDTLPSDDERRKVVERVLEQVRRIDGTVRDLLAYARPKPARFQPTDLNQLVEHALRLVALLPGERVRIVKILEDDLPTVSADTELMGQVLSNLFINAVQAMPQGGTLTVTTSHAATDVRVTVRDTGEGIPPDKLVRIFTPFYTTKTRGTGLGLSICQRVLEAHRGEVSVSSRVGEGTEFAIRIPAEARV